MLSQRNRRPWLAAAALVSCLAASAATAPTAMAQSGVRITPDGKRILISKDVGGERWAITHSLPDDTVTGNVFFPGGGDPQFLWCREDARASGMVDLSCWGADRCPLEPCGQDEWAFIAAVSLPESFFAPPGATSALAALAPGAAAAVARGDAVPLEATIGNALDRGAATAAAGSRAARVAGGDGSRALPERSLRLSGRDRTLGGVAGVALPATGVQVTPDVAQTLLSKDVAGQRWAITVHADDGTATGNVFFPGGGEPQFVWCEQRGVAGGEVRLACSGAPACGAAGCAADDWTFIAEVSLPVGFFEAPQQIDLATFTAILGAALGEDTATRAILLAADQGYSLQQIVRAGLAGRLEASGLILTHAGGAAAPDGPPLGLFTDAVAAASGAGGAGIGDACNAGAADLATVAAEYDLNDFIRIARESGLPPGMALIQVITALLAEGYEAETVVSSLLTGASVEVDVGLRIVERDGAGNRRVLEPENPPIDDDDGDFDSLPPIRYGVCGNGQKEGLESCEPGLPIEFGCADIFPRDFTGGALACTEDCHFDRSACTRPATCGNGVIDENEDCDGENFEGATCRDVGFFAGDLACTRVCSFATYGCKGDFEEPRCGDRLLDGDEQCDRTNFGGATCRSEGFTEGDLRCTQECRIDTSDCTLCGNGVREGSEQCDGADPGGRCEDFGYGPGTVGCSATCFRDFSACQPLAECGNGVREGSETCDGSDFGGETCQSRGFTGGHLHCTAGCAISESECTSEQCPGPDVECGSGCMPAGGDCCNGAGDYCSPGAVCAGNGCCPAALPEACPPNSCMPAGGVCCGNGQACNAGQVCVLGGTACCPASLPKACADSGVCVPAGAPCP